MDQTDNPNPILPVPGVDRNSATSTEASLRRQNDDRTVNRMRGVMSEDGQRVEALLRCRKQSLIGTLNVDTVKDNRATELDHCREALGMEILGSRSTESSTKVTNLILLNSSVLDPAVS